MKSVTNSANSLFYGDVFAPSLSWLLKFPKGPCGIQNVGSDNTLRLPRNQQESN